jgi:hypothetical protein
LPWRVAATGEDCAESLLFRDDIDRGLAVVGFHQYLAPKRDSGRAEEFQKLQMNIPETVVFPGTEPPFMLFTNPRGFVDAYVSWA